MSEKGVDWLSGGRRHELATERIHQAARELLADRGVDKFTAEAVAARAGCSRATLYRHVGGKNELLTMVLTDAARRVGEQVEKQVCGLTGPEQVTEAVLASVHAIRSTPALDTWFQNRRNTFADDYLRNSDALTTVAAALTGIPETDTQAAQWVVRIVLMLLAWPAEEAASERALIERFLTPSFDTNTGP